MICFVIIGSVVPNAYFGQAVGPIHLDGIFCYGEELSILQCDHVQNPVFITHAEDVGLKCFKRECLYQYCTICDDFFTVKFLVVYKM